MLGRISNFNSSLVWLPRLLSPPAVVWLSSRGGSVVRLQQRLRDPDGSAICRRTAHRIFLHGQAHPHFSFLVFVSPHHSHTKIKAYNIKLFPKLLCLLQLFKNRKEVI